jgi:hypothetical protein
VTGQSLPTIPAYPTNHALPRGTAFPTGTATPTLPSGTKSPTPTPSHAARCSGTPNRNQILNLINGKPGIPAAALKVTEGPFCSGTWSFTTVALAAEDADVDERLSVVATGRGATLSLVAAGSDVCIDQVQTGAPPGIRVLACGF